MFTLTALFMSLPWPFQAATHGASIAPRTQKAQADVHCVVAFDPEYWLAEQTVETPCDDVATPIAEDCIGGGTSASASVKSQGKRVTASGRAWDNCPGGDATIQAACTGIYGQNFRYHGPSTKQGTVRVVDVSCSVNGSADLIDDDCAAASLGYSEFTSSVTEKISAILTASVGETTTNQLGDLSGAFIGLGISVPITAGTGTGTYPDNDENSTASTEVCDNTFWYRKRARGFIKCYANGFVTAVGHSKGSMTGRVTLSAVLGVKDTPPPD